MISDLRVQARASQPIQAPLPRPFERLQGSARGGREVARVRMSAGILIIVTVVVHIKVISKLALLAPSRAPFPTLKNSCPRARRAAQ